MLYDQQSNFFTCPYIFCVLFKMHSDMLFSFLKSMDCFLISDVIYTLTTHIQEAVSGHQYNITPVHSKSATELKSYQAEPIGLLLIPERDVI